MRGGRNLTAGFVMLAVSACAEAPPADSPPADPAALQNLMRIFETGCQSEEAFDAEAKKLMRDAGLTIEGYCECTSQEIFGDFTEYDLNLFMRDSQRYEDGVSSHEPWETRINVGALRCLGDDG